MTINIAPGITAKNPGVKASMINRIKPIIMSIMAIVAGSILPYRKVSISNLAE
jgi:hypothetical protein